ncbi:MAG: cadherin domain-containing protein, partial [Flammeovirgaceae bacterium]
AGETFSSTFTIRVTDENDIPTELALSNTSIPENEAALAVIGVLSTVDEDVNDTHNYRFSNLNGGGVDNGAFILVEDTLKALNPFDFEVQEDYVIQITTDDGASGSFTQDFTIEVRNVNEQADALFLSSDSILENSPIGAIVGILSVNDQDQNDTHTYQIIGGTGQTAFSIDGSLIKANQVVNFEETTSYTLIIEVRDGGGANFSETFTIRVIDVNEAPTAIVLTNINLFDNLPINSSIAQLETEDEDMADSHTYTLVSGTGDIHNSQFTLAGNLLRNNEVIDFEVISEYFIRVQVEDENGNQLEQALSLSAVNVNDPPTDLSLSNLTIAENQPSSSVVGVFSVVDQDTQDSHTYELIAGVGGEDNGDFSIVGNVLQANSSLDYESDSTRNILVEVTDNEGASYSEAFVIKVSDINESPISNDVTFEVEEHTIDGTSVGTITASDVDLNQTLTFEVMDTEEELAFAIDAATGELTVNQEALLDYEVTPTFTFEVIVSDNGTPALKDTARVIINLIDLLETDLPVTNFVSPNDDGHNDTWAIQNVAQYSGYELVIYDANGLEVYRASEYNNEWAGQSTDGRELPQGTYFYRFMKSGAAINYKGSITLVR